MNKDNHYWTIHEGMSVPNGHTNDFIEYTLESGKYEKFNLVENDGDSDEVIYLGKEDNKHKFKRVFNNQIVFYNTHQIHLLKRLYK